eukprot:1139897-Pelagomonas_calceolata.AAC.7
MSIGQSAGTGKAASIGCADEYEVNAGIYLACIQGRPNRGHTITRTHLIDHVTLLRRTVVDSAGTS